MSGREVSGKQCRRTERVSDREVSGRQRFANEFQSMCLAERCLEDMRPRCCRVGKIILLDNYPLIVGSLPFEKPFGS